jgi:hypothetical protein
MHHRVQTKNIARRQLALTYRNLVGFMDSAETIRSAVLYVEQLQQSTASNIDLRDALHRIKLIQAQRFAGTYGDLLASSRYAKASHFFLTELYSERSYVDRDAQFGRIAGALQRFFPDAVVATAVTMAKLHALTEELDYEMACQWIAVGKAQDMDLAERYLKAWQSVGRSDDRDRQLNDVLRVGHDLTKLTRTKGLRMMLRMMRAPASAAGLGALQAFLESGFDTFSDMARDGDAAESFLGVVTQRESQWLSVLYDANQATAAHELKALIS